MKYALLAYSRERRSDEPRGRDMPEGIARVLERPYVTDWLRLLPPESATTVALEARRTLLTDGPFVDSKEHLGGVIVIDVDNLDDALAVAGELQELGTTAAIEVRPVFEQGPPGA